MLIKKSTHKLLSYIAISYTIALALTIPGPAVHVYAHTPVQAQPETIQPKCIDTLQIQDMTIQCEHLNTIIKHFGKDATLIAIIIQESRFNPLATNVNTNKSIDRGIYQLNSTWWKFKAGDFTHNTLQAVQCKKELGYSCWWAYRNGDYKKNLLLANEILSKI